MTIATTILAQLGSSNRLTAMIGAKLFLDCGNGLRFKFTAKAKNRSNCIAVTLDPTDTYTVVFNRIHGTNVTEVSSHSDVYADGLRSLIEDETGLYLAL